MASLAVSNLGKRSGDVCRNTQRRWSGAMLVPGGGDGSAIKEILKNI